VTRTREVRAALANGAYDAAARYLCPAGAPRRRFRRSGEASRGPEVDRSGGGESKPRTSGARGPRDVSSPQASLKQAGRRGRVTAL
jgi:hypothetical protein